MHMVYVCDVTAHTDTFIFVFIYRLDVTWNVD